MCGIWAYLGDTYSDSECRSEFMRIAGRGPDYTAMSQVGPNCWLGFHRLAIVQAGDTPSDQPIVADQLSVVCNGEIYNHMKLKARSVLPDERVQNGGSDCAGILHAFHTHGDLRKCCTLLDGVFAFVMVDQSFMYVGRDPIGVRPLFYGLTKSGFVFGSEVKSIEKLSERVNYFPPGCCAQIPLKSFSKELLNILPFYNIPTVIARTISVFNAQEMIRTLLINCVEKRLMGNRLFGFMLSGGLDSSLIASIASKKIAAFGGRKPVAFSVGFADSPDLENARRVAKFLDIPHRVLVITPEQCIAAISDVVYALETFDPLLIRCGVAHFLLCKFIAAESDVKILLSGEGADELFGSYAYMQCAPSHAHLHREILRRLKHLHQYDVLRCDRSTSCHGLEIRVPFLDKKFVELVARLPPSYKLMENKLEKHLLRSAFSGWLPDEVLWRSKEGFSEALGKVDLGQVIQSYVGERIPDEQYAQRSILFPWQTPQTKEEFWYRALFEGFYNLNKVDNLIHTKIYRTAAWHVNSDFQKEPRQLLSVREQENLFEDLEEEDPEARFRQKSTESAKFSGVA